MYENQEVYTITLITEGDNSKLLLSTNEVPAKEDIEASGIIYREDLPEQFNEIVSKIPIFKMAIEEDGNEESVSHTIEEFLDLYELDLLNIIEAGEELLVNSEIRDNTDDEAVSYDSIDPVFIGEDADLAEYDTTSADPFAIYGGDEPPSEDDAMSHIDPREIF